MLYIDKNLKPLELSIKSYRGNAYNIEHLYDVDAMIKKKHERGHYQIDDEDLLKQKKKPTDLFFGFR